MSQIGSLKMKKVMMFIMMALLVLPLVAAQTVETVSDETELVFRQSETFDLKIACFDENNTPCVPSTICRLTVNDPDMINLIDGQNMTHNNNFYNYTVDSTLVTNPGRYSAVVRCSGLTNGFSTFSFLITHDGIDPTEGVTMSYFAVGLFGLLVATGLLIFGFTTRKFIFNILGGMILMLIGTFLLANGIPGIDNLFLTNGIGIVILGLGAYFTIFESTKFSEPNYGQ